jgi:hypothetical protein
VLKVTGSRRPPSTLIGAPQVMVADEAFHSILDASERLLDTLLKIESAKARYCVFGGWLRDTLASRSLGTPLPRDVDLVVEGVDLTTLVGLLPPDVRPTMFGGVQSSATPVPFDIWPLHETFLIRILRLPVSFESLLQTADFDINTAIYFPPWGRRSSTIVDAGMLKALESRQISFNSSHLPFPVLQCARLAAYAAKLSFSFAPPVLKFMRSFLGDHGRRIEVVTGLTNHLSAPTVEKAIEIVNSIAEGEF